MSFKNRRVGRTVEEQIQLNKPAMDYLKTLIDKDTDNSTSIDIANDELDNFQKIIDANRPIGRKVFSKSITP